MRKLILFLFPFALFSCGTNSAPTDNTDKDSVIVDSLTWFNQQIESNPNNLNVLFERAKFHMRREHVDLAQQDLEKYLSKDSTNLNVHLSYADVMMAMLNLEKGKYHYEYVLLRDSLNTSAYIGMGKMHALLDNSAQSLVYLNKALMINPYLSEPYFMKGMIYRSDYYTTGREESWKIAVSSFQTAVEQDPNYYSAFVQLGVMYDEVGDSSALEYYESALTIYPESIEAWYNKGMYYQNRGNIEEALNCYRTLHTIDSTWADPYYNEGYIYLLIEENLDSAVYYFEQATHWDPNFFQAFNNLGLAHEKKKDLTSAKYYYSKAVEINPDFKLAKENLNRLR